jgi:hypothetical protein
VSGAGGNVYEPNFKRGTVTVMGCIPYFNGQSFEDQKQKNMAKGYKKIVS